MRRHILAFAAASLPISVQAGGHPVGPDVLLEPDVAMLEASANWNARIREPTPKGFERDEAHGPHVTLLQRHVERADLDAVLAAVARLQSGRDLDPLRMTGGGRHPFFPGRSFRTVPRPIRPLDGFLIFGCRAWRRRRAA